MQTVSFSLRPAHRHAISRAALRQHVSQSEIVRQALDTVLCKAASPTTGGRAATPTPGNPSYLTQAMKPLAKELAMIRRELDDLRQVVVRLDATGVLLRAKEPASYPAAFEREDE